MNNDERRDRALQDAINNIVLATCFVQRGSEEAWKLWEAMSHVREVLEGCAKSEA